MSDDDLDRRALAHHEAAHAVVQYRASGSAAGAVSILPGDGTRGHAADVTSDSANPLSMEARILSCYAGGHAQRVLDPAQGDQGCGADEEIAAKLLAEWAWKPRETELREKSLRLVQKYWPQIVVVARELLDHQVLAEHEVELLADMVACSVGLGAYRQREEVRAWRQQQIAAAVTAARQS